MMYINSKYPWKHFFLDARRPPSRELPQPFYGIFLTDQIYERKIITFLSHITEIMKLITFFYLLKKHPQHMIEIQSVLKEPFNKTSRSFMKEWVYKLALKCSHRWIIFTLMKKIRDRVEIFKYCVFSTKGSTLISTPTFGCKIPGYFDILTC